MSDMSQFCARQPDACEVGSQALTQFGHKAQASAKWVYDFLTAKLGDSTDARSRASRRRAAEARRLAEHADRSPIRRRPGAARQRQAEAKRPQ